jgi:hypothetical protein
MIGMATSFHRAPINVAKARRARYALFVLVLFHATLAAYGTVRLVPQRLSLTDAAIGLAVNAAFLLVVLYCASQLCKGGRIDGAMGCVCFLLVGWFVRVGLVLYGQYHYSLYYWVLESGYIGCICANLYLLFRIDGSGRTSSRH